VLFHGLRVLVLPPVCMCGLIGQEKLGARTNISAKLNNTSEALGL
jgi:hypothetical protein